MRGSYDLLPRLPERECAKPFNFGSAAARGISQRVAVGRTDAAGYAGLILGDTVKLVTLGAVIGLPITVGGAHLISSQLYQVKPTDFIVVSMSIAVLSLVAVLAGYLPARRAARIDPAVALRAE